MMYIDERALGIRQRAVWPWSFLIDLRKKGVGAREKGGGNGSGTAFQQKPSILFVCLAPYTPGRM